MSAYIYSKAIATSTWNVDRNTVELTESDVAINETKVAESPEELQRLIEVLNDAKHIMELRKDKSEG